MSTKELAYSLIDKLDEKQLDALVVILEGMSGAYSEQLNAETLEALNEVKDMKRFPEKYKGYDDVDEMFKELLA
ncbi:MAG: hypothetical protein MRZ39_06975 [Oscillospiraceae bacterium]|nr:hypothetical protein [Oscillospiraceae bacterium]